MAAIKHTDTERTWSLHYFKSARRTNRDFSGCQKNTLGHYWMCASDDQRWLTVEWRSDRMGLENLVNLGSAPLANTLNHVMLSCRALRVCRVLYQPWDHNLSAICHVNHSTPTLSNTYIAQEISCAYQCNIIPWLVKALCLIRLYLS